MKREKATAGPFTIGECIYGEHDETEDDFENTRGYLILNAHGEHVAIVMGADRNYTEIPEGAANARLIAAAPDMLIALEYALRLATRHGVNAAELAPIADAIRKASA